MSDHSTPPPAPEPPSEPQPQLEFRYGVYPSEPWSNPAIPDISDGSLQTSLGKAYGFPSPSDVPALPSPPSTDE